MRLPEWRTIKSWLSAFVGTGAAAATSYLAWAQLHPEDTEAFWEVVSIAVLGVVAIGSAFAPVFRTFTVERYERKRDKVATLLRALPWTIHQITDGRVPVRPLGASAFVVRGMGPFQWLHRIGHERVNDTPGPTLGIRWTKGKGIIGICWETGNIQCVNTAAFDSSHGSLSEEEWNALPASKRRRLSYKEYQRIRGKYGTVIAVAMVHRERVVGVVALDAPPGCHGALRNKGVEAVGQAAGVITNLLM